MKHSRKICLAAAVAMAVWSTGAVAETLTVTAGGGAFQDTLREVYFDPFKHKFKVDLVEDQYSYELSKIKAMVDSNNVTWDVVNTDSNMVIIGCEQGLFEKLDYSQIGPKDDFIKFGAMDCGAGNVVSSTIFFYDKEKFKGETPKTLQDFFDLQKFPGKRGMWKRPYVNLEWALMADGVPKSEVYKVLATEEGLERAFKKLDTIKSEVIWWEAGAQPTQLVGAGEAVMSTGWNGRIDNAIKEGRTFQIVWDGHAIDLNYWSIVKGSPNKDLAMKFIQFASEPEVMKNHSIVASYGPSRKSVGEMIDPDRAENIPTSSKNLDLGYSYDPEFWAEHGEELVQRFNNWLAQ